jgi:hypothetical protein
MLPFDLPFDKLRVNGYAILASSMTTRRPPSTEVVLSRHALTLNAQRAPPLPESEGKREGTIYDLTLNPSP